MSYALNVESANPFHPVLKREIIKRDSFQGIEKYLEHAQLYLAHNRQLYAAGLRYFAQVSIYLA